MGKYAEIAFVDYRLSFTEGGNKLPVFVFVCSKQTEDMDMETWTGDMDIET
jgi:hypothetical protein